MRALADRLSLTTPDLVLLSLLAEQCMHGYQANLELERRDVRDWADISRPQVYYSLKKLARMKLIRIVSGRGTHRVSRRDSLQLLQQSDVVQRKPRGPARRIYATTSAGRRALAQALERPGWTSQRPPPPFLTWMALSWLARQGAFRRQLLRRRRYLQRQLARERISLRSILEEVGHRYHEAVWVVSLTIRQFELELRWLRDVERQSLRRAAARHPQIAPA